MTVQGVIVTDEQALALCRKLMGLRSFRCADLEDLAVQAGFTWDGYLAYRVAGRIIDREKKSGRIEAVDGRTWRWARTQFSFCEGSAAGSSGRWHIRMLSPVGQKPSGGIDTPGLCGHPTPMSQRGGSGGWDVTVVIDDHHLGHSCQACVAEYRKLMADPAKG
jgi:hypothetical protein